MGLKKQKLFFTDVVMAILGLMTILFALTVGSIPMN